MGIDRVAMACRLSFYWPGLLSAAAFNCGQLCIGVILSDVL